jgi:1-aminocyclopropane-1-carboxylate deaminase
MTLHFKRDDLLHPTVQGNKWRKLHRLLARLRDEGAVGVVSFGGPFSNSLHALAHAGPVFGLPTAAILRGVAADFDNPTLADAQQQGMALFPVPKTAYDVKLDAPEVQAVLAQLPGYHILPEGGATPEGLRGCMDIATEILDEYAHVPLDKLYIAVPAGTGCTAAGIVAGMAGRGRVLVFPAANYGVDPSTVAAMLTESGYPIYQNYQFFPEFVMGKFARPATIILDHAAQFEAEHGFRLDPFYTSRMVYGLHQLEQRGFFQPDDVVVAVHTGGLQAWRGMDR